MPQSYTFYFILTKKYAKIINISSFLTKFARLARFLWIYFMRMIAYFGQLEN